MINQRIVRYLKDLLLQILQVLDAHDLLLRLWIQDDEIAETKTLHDLLPQILRITLGILSIKEAPSSFAYTLLLASDDSKTKGMIRPVFRTYCPNLYPA